MIGTKDIHLKIGRETIDMIFVKGGTYKMGGEEFDWEKPIHEVTIPSFYIAQFLVTQKIYQEVMNHNPSYFKGERRPVENVSWDDAKKFIMTLNKLEESKSLKGAFRLPTEAEWEYAARGGKYSQGYEYSGSDDLKQVGWFDGNSGGETKPVGLLQANELGIYDMSGNVREWCEDDWHSDYNAPDRPDDGSAWIDVPNRGANRVVRGGYYFNDPVYCRPAYRINISPAYRFDSLGFRLVFSPQLQESPSDIP